MNEQTITCPTCETIIPLSEALSAQLEEKLKKQFVKENSAKLQAVTAEKERLEKKEAEIEMMKKSLDAVVENRMAEERKKLEIQKAEIEKEAENKAMQALSVKMKDLESQNREKEEALEKAQEEELNLRKKVREVEAQKKNLDLEIERKVGEERERIDKDIREELDTQHRLKLAEKEKKLEQMAKTIDDLKRKSEQGSMQIQGDVLENDLKELISNSFPIDSVEDVPTGIKGADLIHRVKNNYGEECGIILWESKNTKSWSKDWVAKAKQDQASARADLCILVSKVMPEKCKYFVNVDNVWVCEYTHVLPLVAILRMGLHDVFKAKQSAKGKDEKMEVLYSYLSGSQFTNRVQNIVHTFKTQQEDLATEKRAMERSWSKREKSIQMVISSMASMYGDLEAIVGATLPEVPSLTLAEGNIEGNEDMSF